MTSFHALKCISALSALTLLTACGAAPQAANRSLMGMDQEEWRSLSNSASLESLTELVPAEALKNASGTHYKALTWSDKEVPGPRQVAFARKLAQYPEVKGSETAVTMSPYYDFLHLLKTVIEDVKSFDPDKVKRAMDNVKNYPGLLGPISFTPANHTGIGPDEIVMGTLSSVKDSRAMGVFRERAR